MSRIVIYVKQKTKDIIKKMARSEDKTMKDFMLAKAGVSDK